MGKKGKKGKKEESKNDDFVPPSLTPIILPLPPLLSLIWASINEFTSRIYKVIGVLLTIITILTIREPVSELFMTEQEIWEKKNFIKGVRIPLKVMEGTKIITIDAGRNWFEYTTEFLSMDRAYFDLSKTKYQINLQGKMIDDKFYISTKLYDLKTQAEVGEMDFNKWKWKSSLIYDTHRGDNENDDNMEVLDQYGNVIFNMQYIDSISTVKIQGYFVTKYGITVISPEGIWTFSFAVPGTVEKAQKEIVKIQRLNKY